MRVSEVCAAQSRRLGSFGRERDGAVTVEFVIAVPLLLAVLAFAVQYGFAMQVRNALDVAVRDAARYMSRAPIDPATATVDARFLDKATALVEARVGRSAAVSVNDLRITADVAAIRATATVHLPLLEALVLVTGTPDLAQVAMVACEGWTVPESGEVRGVLAERVSAAPFADCPDGTPVGGSFR
jgi:Flp pilus assembly protein TadG